ncbi:MAG: rhomboid family intramembrane serine protease [Bacteroidia bacterium]|nr:rhomboid family intramembrane serine protease [Bacteroidia bacterium]
MPQRLTPIVRNLLLLNVGVWLVWQFSGDPENLARYLLLWKTDVLFPRPDYSPYGFEPVQLVGAFFSHERFTHLLFNMLGLYFLGVAVELVMGSQRFLAFYLFVGVTSTLAVAVLDPTDNPVLGASGAISGLLMAFAFYFPSARLSLLFLPFVSFKAIHFALGLFAFSAFMVFGVEDQGQVSHFGHLMGMVMGILYFVVERKQMRRPW